MNELDLEAGVGLVQQRLQPDPAVDVTVGDNFLSGRAAARFKHLFTKTTYFQQTLEFLPEPGDHQRLPDQQRERAGGADLEPPRPQGGLPDQVQPRAAVARAGQDRSHADAPEYR